MVRGRRGVSRVGGRRLVGAPLVVNVSGRWILWSVVLWVILAVILWVVLAI